LKLHYVPKENFSIKLGWAFKKEDINKDKKFYWFNTLTGETTEKKDITKRFYQNPWHRKADAILVSIVADTK